MKKIPFGFTLLKGAIGKRFVVKHYSKGLVITKYPDMTRIVASKKQASCRRLFKEASAYAVSIIDDRAKREALALRIRKNTGLYNAAIKEYMLSARSIGKDKTRSRKRLPGKAIWDNVRTTLKVQYSPSNYAVKRRAGLKKKNKSSIYRKRQGLQKILHEDNMPIIKKPPRLEEVSKIMILLI